MSTRKGKEKETLPLPQADEVIDRVKILIEKCLVHNMNRNEVIEALYEEHEIDHTITEIIWQALVKQNPEFFQNYYSKLIMKEQAEMMKQSNDPETLVSSGESSGSNVPPINSDHGMPYLLEQMSIWEDSQKEEKQRVKDLIKQYIFHYPTQKQVIDILYQTEKIEPSYTMAVWEELEQQDPIFFKDYCSQGC